MDPNMDQLQSSWYNDITYEQGMPNLPEEFQEEG